MHKKIVVSQFSFQKRIATVSLSFALILMLFSYKSYPDFFSYCGIIAVINVFSLLVGFFWNSDKALHIFFIVHLCAFTAAPFLGLGGVCFLVVYPIIYVWALFSNTSSKLGLVYFIVNTICAIITVLKLRQVIAEGGAMLPIAFDIVVTIGMMLCISIIVWLYFDRVALYKKLWLEKEDVLSAKNEQLEKYIQTNLRLENFAHIASHELKTPVRSIANYAGLMELSANRKLNKEEKEYLAYIQSQAKQMYRLTNDLLKLASVSGGIVDYISFKPYDEWSVISTPLINKERQNITFGDLPTSIMGDKEQLSILMKNLLENSIKYGRRDDGDLRIEVYGSTHDDYHHIHVVDFGHGIPNSEKEEIFSLFKRLSHSDEGTGIGLTLCRKIVENHDGSIEVLDGPTGGADFYWRIPIR